MFTAFLEKEVQFLLSHIFDEKLLVVIEVEEEDMVFGCHSFHGCSFELWVILEFEIQQMYQSCCCLVSMEVEESLAISTPAHI